MTEPREQRVTLDAGDICRPLVHARVAVPVIACQRPPQVLETVRLCTLGHDGPAFRYRARVINIIAPKPDTFSILFEPVADDPPTAPRSLWRVGRHYCDRFEATDTDPDGQPVDDGDPRTTRGAHGFRPLPGCDDPQSAGWVSITVDTDPGGRIYVMRSQDYDAWAAPTPKPTAHVKTAERSQLWDTPNES